MAILGLPSHIALIIMCSLFLISTVRTESTEAIQGDEELKMTIILFSEGVFIPSSDLFMERNWVQKIGAGNLHLKGKDMLRQIGQFERQLMKKQGKSFSQRDVVMYAQDRNISIVGAYSFLQGLFSPASGSATQKGTGQPSTGGQMPQAPSSPAFDKGELGLTSVKAESGNILSLEEPYDTSFLDVPIITNHNRFDPVLSTFGPSCPNIQMERERFADQSRYRDISSKHSGFLTALNNKVFEESQVKIDSLKKAASLYEYLIAEQIINGSNELNLEPFEIEQLRDINSFVKYYAHFFQKKLIRSGSALLFQQITKDFREKIGEDFHTDSERESLLRSNKDKLIAGYSLSSAVIANFLVAFNLSNPDCQGYTVDASSAACLEWPSYGSSIRLQLIQQKSTSSYFVKFYYNNASLSLGLVVPPLKLIPLKSFLELLRNSTLESFNAYCGAEWLIGKKVVETFMGLVFFNIAIISLTVMLLIIIFFMKVKINNLKAAKEMTELEDKKVDHHLAADQN